MAKLSKKPVSATIQKYSGNVSAMARHFRVDRVTMYKFCRETHPELWAEIEDQREVWLDDAESELRRQANEDGNTTALIFFLKTQGKRRGYVERQEVTGADGKSLSIALKWSDNGEGDDNPDA